MNPNSLTRFDLASGIIEVEVGIHEETISLQFFDTSNGIHEICNIALFHDEIESFRDLLTRIINSRKLQDKNRIVAKNQTLLIDNKMGATA